MNMYEYTALYLPASISCDFNKKCPSLPLAAKYPIPMAVANVKGTANQQRPPNRNPHTPSLGLAATLLCQ